MTEIGISMVEFIDWTRDRLISLFCLGYIVNVHTILVLLLVTYDASKTGIWKMYTIFMAFVAEIVWTVTGSTACVWVVSDIAFIVDFYLAH